MKPFGGFKELHMVGYCHYMRKTGCMIRIEAGYWQALIVEGIKLKVFTRKWYTSSASTVSDQQRETF